MLLKICDNNSVIMSTENMVPLPLLVFHLNIHAFGNTKG